MKKLSKLEKALIYAYEKGYRINKNGEAISPTGKKLSCNLSKSGYLRFSIKTPQETYAVNVFVHRLKAYQIYGKKILEKGIQVRHLDGCPTNNKKKNIAIGTQSENRMDVPKKQREKISTDAGRANSILTKKDIESIRFLREKKGYKYSDILKIYPIAKSTLSYICNYKTWKNI